MVSAKISLGAIMAIAATALFLTITTAGLLTVNESLVSSGVVAGPDIGVFSDSSCAQNMTSINWGTLNPGQTVARTAYVKNLGNTPLTLSMSTSNWNPTNANGPLIMNWNRQNVVINPGNYAVATLTLTVSPDISGITNFSFNIIISGTG